MERFPQKKLFIVVVLTMGIFFLWKSHFGKPSESKFRDEIEKEEGDLGPITIKTPSMPSFKIERTSFPKNRCDISAYGATPGGETKNTESFKKAVSDCARLGGGTVFVPKGLWLTGPIHLESNINLNLDEEAEIIFSADFEDYLPVVLGRFEGVEIYNFSPPIYARDKTNIAITGKGKLNGRSKDFWWKTNKNYETVLNLEKIYQIARDARPLEERIFGKSEEGIRPNFIEFINCDRILLEDVEIIDGPMWTIHPVYSQNIIVRGISIKTHKGANTDGVVIDSSRNVLVENSFFSTGDDSIAVKSGRDEDGKRVGRISENVVARNIRVEETHSAMAIGSEVSGGIRNIFASGFSIKKADFGFRVKSGPTRGSFVENVRLENFEMEFSEIAGFEIDLNYGRDENGPALEKDDPTDFKNIEVKNFSSEKSHYPFFLKGHEKKSPENISFENIKINSKNDARIWNAENISFENLDLYSDKDKLPKIKTINSRGISIKKSAFNPERIICEREPCEFSFE